MRTPHYSSPDRRRVLQSERHAGFTLVLAMTVMALVLLLGLSLSALFSLELKMTRSVIHQAKARLNALAGARIALGELQRTLGPDQRVSATADILTSDDLSDPLTDDAYKTETKPVVHPRWVGVWNAGPVSGQAVAEVAPGQENRVLQRTAHGYLVDSRFTNGTTWEDARAGENPTTVTRRLMTWLVSGNEGLPTRSPDTVTPFSPVTPEDVVLLGSGSLGDLFRSQDAKLDKLGARSRRVALPDAGGYAYWISDEGVKARINLTDPAEDAGLKPSATAPGNGGYTRLLIPRRNRFDLVTPAIAGGPKIPLPPFSPTVKVETTGGFEELVDAKSDAAALRAHYFHDITFVSAGVLSDVANGGFKKDLSAYLQSGDIGDFPGAPGSGIMDEAPLLAEPTLAKVSPKFGMLRHWWTTAPEFGTTGAAALGAMSFEKTFVQTVNRIQPAFSFTHREKIPDAANFSQAPRVPIVAEFTLYFRTFVDNTAQVTGQAEARWLHFPRIVLWNPYAVPLRLNKLLLNCRNSWGWRPALPWGVDGPVNFSHVGLRPLLRYRFPENLTLAPGQSVMFVADRRANVATDPAPGVRESPALAYAPRDVFLKEGLPTPDGYYVNSMIRTKTGTSSAIEALSGRAVQRRLNNLLPDATLLAGNVYDDSKNPGTQMFLTDGDGANTTALGHLNFDTYAGGLDSKFIVGNLSAETEVAHLSSLFFAAPSPPPYRRDKTPFVSYRLKRWDTADAKDATVNVITDANVRAPVQARYPFDAVKSMYGEQAYSHGGAWETGHDPYYALTAFPPSAREYVPLTYNLPDDTGYTGYPAHILFDTPYKEIGLHSLAQLRHAPMNPFAHGPALPFASGRVPLPGEGGGVGAGAMTHRTGITLSELNAAWNSLSTWANANTQVRQLNRIGAESHDIFDVAFELNHALWDSHWLSGIDAENAGRKSPSAAWENRKIDASGLAHTLPHSRLTDAGTPRASGGYFASPHYALLKPAHTLLMRGAFNVNSTSRAAWLSLLASCRGIAPATRGAASGAPPDSTPFPRLLYPKSGSAPAASGFADTTWSGFRSLSDAELGRLADAIVAQVKQRGPFLSLSDFVNRRLRTPNPAEYGKWADYEKKYLGTIEAAISAAKLNDPFDTDGATAMNRSETDAGAFTTVLRKPQHRSASRIAGAPGYLEQGDILQAIAPVLTARSDTFVIRARGDAEGATAVVEMTVQRSPEPIIAATGGTTPVNPRSSTAPGYVGNQFMGRRMQVIATAWKLPDEL